jgi:hypothetical protein
MHSTSRRAIKTYEGVGVYIHVILISELNEG